LITHKALVNHKGSNNKGSFSLALGVALIKIVDIWKDSYRTGKAEIFLCAFPKLIKGGN